MLNRKAVSGLASYAAWYPLSASANLPRLKSISACLNFSRASFSASSAGGSSARASTTGTRTERPSKKAKTDRRINNHHPSITPGWPSRAASRLVERVDGRLASDGGAGAGRAPVGGRAALDQRGAGGVADRRRDTQVADLVAARA